MNVTVLTTDGVGCCYLLYLCTSYVATALDADAPNCGAHVTLLPLMPRILYSLAALFTAC